MFYQSSWLVSLTFFCVFFSKLSPTYESLNVGKYHVKMTLMFVITNFSRFFIVHNLGWDTLRLILVSHMQQYSLQWYLNEVFLLVRLFWICDQYKITEYEIYFQDTNTHKASKMSYNNDLYIAVELFPHNLWRRLFIKTFSGNNPGIY